MDTQDLKQRFLLLDVFSTAHTAWLCYGEKYRESPRKGQETERYVFALATAVALFAASFLTVRGLNRYFTPQMDLQLILSSCTRIPAASLGDIKIGWENSILSDLINTLFITRIVLNLSLAYMRSGSDRRQPSYRAFLQGVSLCGAMYPVLEVVRQNIRFEGLPDYEGDPLDYQFPFLNYTNADRLREAVERGFDNSCIEIQETQAEITAMLQSG